MQIVIKLDDDIVEGIKQSDMDSARMAVRNFQATIADAIKKGTPLPKGHGRLITEPTEEEIAKTIGGKNDFADCIREAVKYVFANAQTIIEADKEE